MNNNSLPFHKWLPLNGSIENPIVFLHGFLETHTIWYHLPLSDLKRPILLVDIPGFGKSNLFDDHHPSIRYFSDEVSTLLDVYGVNTCQIVGHSMGGYVGLELLKNNESVRKLVLLNSNFWTDSDVKKTERTRVADILLKNKNLFISEAIPNLFLNPEHHRSEVNELIREAKSGIAEWYAYASIAMREREDFTSFLKEHPEHFEIIHGERDSLFSTELIQEKCKGWKSIYILQNSGHMSLFEHPRNVIDFLLELLDK